MSKSFKLLAFNTYDDNNNNDSDSENSNDTENSKEKNESKYMVQMFGINEKGETITIYAEDYLPFFYVKVNNDWNNSKKK